MNDRSKRIDTVSRIIKAPPKSVYRAYMDPKALVVWLPPKGMEGRIDAFDAWEGGIYRMTLTYIGSDHPKGKSSDSADVAQGEFLELAAASTGLSPPFGPSVGNRPTMPFGSNPAFNRGFPPVPGGTASGSNKRRQTRKTH